MRRIRLVIADRRPIVLQGFASLFAAQTDFEVVASCLDGAGCLEAVRNLTPDVVLVEDGFSDVTASEMLAVVNAENLPTRLVFFTASVARGDLAAAIAAGACSAISMHERPECLMQSLRLVATRPHRPPAGKDENESVSENVLAVLTDQERKITLLVAQGLSNKAVARQLNVSPGTIKVHLNHIFQKLGINNRTALAALALSQRYGGIGALAALIFAAIDDDQAASASAVDAGHTVTDTFTVMAADGTAEVVTIIINSPKESAGASGTTSRAMIKARGAANGATGTSMSTGKLVDFGSDIAGSTFGWTAFGFARPSSGSYGTFMMLAAAAWIYVIDIIYSAAQAFDLRDSLPDVFPSASASGTTELVTVNIPGSANANFDGSDYSALPDPGRYDRPFALGATRGDTVARGGDERQTFDADAGQDSANGNDNYPDGGNESYPHGGSGSINALIDHGGLGEATATDASTHAEHGTIQASAGDDSNRWQAQRDLHADGDGSAAAEQDARNDPPGDDSSRGQSQPDLHADGDGSAAARQYARNDPPGDDSSRGQSQPDLHADGDGSAAARQHARNDPPGDDSSRGQSQPDLYADGDGSAAARQYARNDPPGDDSSRGQSQPDLHADGDGSAAARQHARNDPPGDDSSHGLSQRDLHADGNGSAAAEQHAKNDPPGDDSSRGLSQRDLHADGDGSAAAEQHAGNDPPGHDSNRGQSQRDLHVDEDGSAARLHAKNDPPGHDSNHGQSQRDLHADEDGSAARLHARNDRPGHDSNHGQSQRDLHADGDGSAAAEQHARNDLPGHDSNHAQSQRDLHVDGDGPAAAEQQARNDPPGHDSNHGQSQRDLRASEDGPAAAEQHARNDLPGHDSNHPQSQRDLHASEDGPAAAEQHARNDLPGHDSNHPQSQRDLHASEDGPAAAEQQARNDLPGHDSNHAQSQRDLHASEDGSAAAERHAKHDATPESEVNRGQSQGDLHAVPANAANNLHSGSSLNAEGKDQPADDAGQAETAAAPAFGDSFHFNKEMGASKASDVFELHVGHGPDSTEHGLHTVGHDGLAPIQEADLGGLSLAEQNAVDHAKGTKHHLTHDLFV